MHKWTPEEHEAMREMVARGDAYSLIAKQFHQTRSAVIGYAARHFPERRRRVGWGPTLTKATMKKTAPKPTPKPKPKAPPPRPAAAVPVVRNSREPKSFEVRLADLQTGECKWPGDYRPGLLGGFPFCGHAVAYPGGPYCKHHAERAGTGYRAEQVVRA